MTTQVQKQKRPEIDSKVIPLQGRPGRPTPVQRSYLARGLEQPGGKLPLFNEQGQLYSERTIRACLEHGWAEAWFSNPLKPDWLVCKLTEAGRALFK
jgi:hypothetical protein|tara:strand:- start:2936 stop:3226 length:291 start_codon:yes stop_codon:yes gene_type:complete